jgi:hypothetical protein
LTCGLTGTIGILFRALFPSGLRFIERDRGLSVALGINGVSAGGRRQVRPGWNMRKRVATDEGTYEGGPASIVPLVLCEEPAEVWDLQSADEWLERRRRFKRFVATVVGGLGAGLVILSVCFLAARARGAEDVNPTRQAFSPHVTTTPVVPAATPVAEAPIAVADAPIAVADAPDGVSELDGRSSPEEATVVAEPAPVVRRAEVTRSRLPSPRASFAPARPQAATHLPRGSVDLPTLSGSISGLRGPPTAVFSN